MKAAGFLCKNLTNSLQTVETESSRSFSRVIGRQLGSLTPFQRKLVSVSRLEPELELELEADRLRGKNMTGAHPTPLLRKQKRLILLNQRKGQRLALKIVMARANQVTMIIALMTTKMKFGLKMVCGSTISHHVAMNGDLLSMYD